MNTATRSNEDGRHGDKDRLHGKEVPEPLGISANCKPNTFTVIPYPSKYSILREFIFIFPGFLMLCFCFFVVIIVEMELETFKITVLPLREKLINISWRMMEDRSDAEDIVQNVFIKLLKSKEIIK